MNLDPSSSQKKNEDNSNVDLMSLDHEQLSNIKKFLEQDENDAGEENGDHDEQNENDDNDYVPDQTIEKSSVDLPDQS